MFYLLEPKVESWIPTVLAVAGTRCLAVYASQDKHIIVHLPVLGKGDRAKVFRRSGEDLREETSGPVKAGDVGNPTPWISGRAR